MKQRKQFLARLILSILILFGAFYVLTFQEIPVLMYHFIGTRMEARENSLTVSAEAFENQLSWLQKWGYRIYSLDEFYKLKTGRRFFLQKGVVITFDDGNISFKDKAVPLLEKYHAPAANFLVWESVQRKENGSISIEEARKFSEHPLITFGAHTVRHTELVGLSDSVLREEIVDCRKHLEKALGKNVWYFAYPGGYFDKQAVQFARDTGYRFAFTTAWKRLKSHRESFYTLTRIKITEKDNSPVLFWYKVSGFYSMFKRMLNAFHY